MAQNCRCCVDDDAGAPHADWALYDAACAITDADLGTAVAAWLAGDAATYGHIRHWDVSAVTSLYATFYQASSFNADLSRWDVSSVANVQYAFYEAAAFNGDLGAWDVSAVTSLYATFYRASAFNADLRAWDVSATTTLYFREVCMRPALYKEASSAKR